MTEIVEKKTQIRIPGGIHSWLKDRARKSNRSLNGEMITIFQAEQARDKVREEEQKETKDA